jgi:hypothetical protein
MRHISRARVLLEKELKEKGLSTEPLKFIHLRNTKNTPGIAPQVIFTIQSDPVKEVGVNGCQAEDILRYTKALFQSLDSVFPCIENTHTIEALETALEWQRTRTRNRDAGGVEGTQAAVPISELTDAHLVDIYDMIYCEVHSKTFKVAEAKDILFNDDYIRIYHLKVGWRGRVHAYLTSIGYDITRLHINPKLND